jgi:peptidase C39-like protein
MAERTLAVPYLTQPTSNTCQSTCLKMYGLYLARHLAMSTPVEGMSILDIWSQINESKDRPSKERNSYTNMVWWLKKNFPSYEFSVDDTRNPDDAMAHVVDRIDAGFPVMVSTNHSNTSGHIILVVGYEGAEKSQCSMVKFVCHDPYGKFNPKLGSKLHGKKRFTGGSSLMGGGEVGPGKGVVYDHDGIRRIRSDKHSNGTYFLISGSGLII